MRIKGFTIIETIVAIAVLALSFGAISGLTVWGYRTHGYALKQAVAINEARKGVKDMVKEIREARLGDDGAYIIEKTGDYEFIFYSDVDKDEVVERVRYFIKPAGGGYGSETKECQSFSKGGSCSRSFSGFLGEDELSSAELRVSLEGDLNSSSERASIYADGNYLGDLCTGFECGQCAGTFEDLTSFDVFSYAQDGSVQFTADGTYSVDPFCDWQQEDHSIKVKFEFSWQKEALTDASAVFKKGVTKPTGWPLAYLPENEEVFIISENIWNENREEPVFIYYDGEHNIVEEGERMEKTRLIDLKLMINVDPNRPPDDFILQSGTQIRNLKQNL